MSNFFESEPTLTAARVAAVTISSHIGTEASRELKDVGNLWSNDDRSWQHPVESYGGSAQRHH